MKGEKEVEAVAAGARTIRRLEKEQARLVEQINQLHNDFHRQRVELHQAQADLVRQMESAKRLRRALGLLLLAWQYQEREVWGFGDLDGSGSGS